MSLSSFFVASKNALAIPLNPSKLKRDLRSVWPIQPSVERLPSKLDLRKASSGACSCTTKKSTVMMTVKKLTNKMHQRERRYIWHHASHRQVHPQLHIMCWSILRLQSNLECTRPFSTRRCSRKQRCLTARCSRCT